MNNSQRWKEFITWWEDYHIGCADDVLSLCEKIDNKIEELKELKG